MNFVIVLLLFNLTPAYSAKDLKKNVTDEYIYHLAAKTPYRVLIKGVPSKIDFQGCQPLKIWMLVRHGTRNPSSSEILQFTNRLPEIRNLILERNQQPNDHLHSSSLYDLQKWTFKVDAARAKFLVHEGEDEMLELAERLQIKFPELFSSIYSNTSYFFKYTASQRTQASAQYFVTGLFGRQLKNDIWYPPALPKDPVLRFYKLCSKWRSEVKNNSKRLTEVSHFINSTHFRSIINSFTQLLKLDRGSLTHDDVRLIYIVCAFETAWNRRKTSPWCKLFNPSVLKAMEFIEDLKYFYRDGYGFKLTYEQACPAFQDMLKYFDSNDTYPKSTVYFTHSGTILKMLAHLGLYNDDRPLLHTDFATNQYQWKISQIDAFGSNIAFVLNRCGNRKTVMVLHQERIVHLPACNSDLCDLEAIKEYYRSSINCNFDKLCNNT